MVQVAGTQDHGLNGPYGVYLPVFSGRLLSGGNLHPATHQYIFTTLAAPRSAHIVLLQPPQRSSLGEAVPMMGLGFSGAPASISPLDAVQAMEPWNSQEMLDFATSSLEVAVGV